MHNKLFHIGDSHVIYACVQRPSELSHRKNFCLLLTSPESIDFLLIKILKRQLRINKDNLGGPKSVSGLPEVIK